MHKSSSKRSIRVYNKGIRTKNWYSFETWSNAQIHDLFDDLNNTLDRSIWHIEGGWPGYVYFVHEQDFLMFLLKYVK